jgi:hypothetical protein
MSNEISRRSQLEKLIPAEQAIRAAAIAVELAGAHPLLTEAGSLLWKAKDVIGDWHDSGAPGADTRKAPQGAFRMCLGAQTGTGADYPSYLSVNLTEGHVAFTVRGPKSEGHEGVSATHKISVAEFRALLAEMATRIAQVDAGVSGA